ncbi:MAG: capsular polysaccharide biosynthesis protein [Ruminococcaceae bacterium]|nr:capsular polysaccharide biosynthesis protein [Oscillospiraceae bacterium]
MVDFHSHILPNIDDGSDSVEESLIMLELLRDQEVADVVATPHFDANAMSVEQFLSRRQEAYAALSSRIGEGLPRIHLGAEVLYYSGITRWDHLDALCIEGTRVLLLEMPLSRWTTSVVREVLALSNTKGITVVLAHVERYIKLQRSGVIEEMLRHGIYMQVNASFFTERRTRRRALKMLRFQQIHLLGSDCHGATVRPPRVGEAVAIIRKKMGDEPVAMFAGCATELISV